MADLASEKKIGVSNVQGDGSSVADGSVVDAEGATSMPIQELRRNFSSRHIQMICLGGCFGSGIFIGTGKAYVNPKAEQLLHYGGAPAIIIGYTLICSLALAVMNVLTESVSLFPTTGSFIDHASRFVDPSVAFAIGFCEWVSWMSVVAAEGAVVRVILTYWTEAVPAAACMTVYLFFVFFVHSLPTRFFAEFEFGTAAIKIVAMIIVLITCICMIAGAGPTGSTYHSTNYRDLPVFPNGFKGVAQSFALAAWATGGQEIMGISAGEARFPRWDMPRACKNLFFRIIFFFVLSTVFIGILVPYNDDRLLSTSTVASSPFVIAMSDAGIKGLPDMINVVIVIGLIAIGGESLYVSSRVLVAMSKMRMLPAIFSRVDKKGRPYTSLLFTAFFSTVMTYINCSNTGAVIFTWFSSIASTTYFMAWMVIAASNWQMHRAIRLQDDPAWKLPHAYKLPGYPATSVYLFVISFFVLFCTGYVSLFPIGGNGASAYSFFETFLGVPIFIVAFVLHKLYFRTKPVNPQYADLKTDRRELTDEDIAFLDAYNAKPLWKRTISYFVF